MLQDRAGKILRAITTGDLKRGSVTEERTVVSATIGRFRSDSLSPRQSTGAGDGGLFSLSDDGIDTGDPCGDVMN